MGDSKSHGLHHLGMLEEHLFNFRRSNFLSASIDNLLAAAHEKQVPIVIEKTAVPCLEPVTREGGPSRYWVPVVTPHNASTTDDNLPRLTAREESSILVQDRDIQTH